MYQNDNYLPREITVSKDWLTSYGTKMVKFYYYVFIPKNILYFRTEQNVHVKWGGGGGILFTIALFYDH